MARITRGKRPYLNGRVPIEDIREAIEMTQSMRKAAEYLGISYPTFRKYAVLYNMFKAKKTNAGIPRSRKTHWTGFETPARPEHTRLLLKLAREGKVEYVCRHCDLDVQRKSDRKSPLLLSFHNNDENDYTPSNLEVLCFNCYFMDWERKRAYVHKRLEDNPDPLHEIASEEILPLEESQEDVSGDDLMEELGSTLANLFNKS